MVDRSADGVVVFKFESRDKSLQTFLPSRIQFTIGSSTCSVYVIFQTLSAYKKYTFIICINEKRFSMIFEI